MDIQLIFFSEEKEEDIKKEDTQYYERTFIEVLNDPHDVVFRKVFNVKPNPIPPKKLKCAVTG